MGPWKETKNDILGLFWSSVFTKSTSKGCICWIISPSFFSLPCSLSCLACWLETFSKVFWPASNIFLELCRISCIFMMCWLEGCSRFLIFSMKFRTFAVLMLPRWRKAGMVWVTSASRQKLFWYSNDETKNSIWFLKSLLLGKHVRFFFKKICKRRQALSRLPRDVCLCIWVGLYDTGQWRKTGGYRGGSDVFRSCKRNFFWAGDKSWRGTSE